MRIFMTGGTGMIGRRLAIQLRDRGDSVSILSRSANEARRQPQLRGIRFVPGDPTIPGEWQTEVNGTDAVVNLAGHNLFAQRWDSSVRGRIRDSRVHSTDQLVLAVAAARTRPSIFLQGSAIGYYGQQGDEELSERAGSGSDFLAVVCRELEAAAAPIESMGVRLATIRTGIVLGRDAGALKAMVPIFRWGLGSPLGGSGSALRPGRGMQWMSWIHLDDIVGLFLLALDEPLVAGPINGTAPEPARNRDFSQALARALHRPCLPVGPPDLLLNLLLGGVATTVTSGQRVIPARALELGYDFKYPGLAEALRAELSRAPFGSGLRKRVSS